MQPVQLPRAEFAICKVLRWSLYRLHDGRFVAHRPSFETVRQGNIFKHDAMFIEWPSAAEDVPEATRKTFDEAMTEWKAGVM